MTHQNTEFTDAEVHAYIDGQLDEARAKALTLRMKKDSQLAKQVEDYQLVNANLRVFLDPVIHESVPEKLLEAGLREPQVAQLSSAEQRRIPMARAAMLAGLMLVSGLMGWLFKGNDAQDANAYLHTNLVQPATFAHSIYASDALRPVEITAENEEQLIGWLSQRLKTDIKAPSLMSQGFQLLGGRLIPSTNRMAAQFMYQDVSGSRVSLYVRRGSWDKENMPLHYEEENGLAAFTWVDNSMGYALSGDIQKKDLLALAETAHLHI